jgi:MFS family permease
MTVGWPIAAAVSGRIYLRIGFRNTALIGSVIVVLGTLLVARLGETSAVFAVAAASFVVGVGLGLCSAPVIVAVQSVVDWQRRGVVTATNMFCRNLGSAVGVAVFGAVANAVLARRSTDSRAHALYDAAHHVFLGVVAAAVVGTLVLWLMPRHTQPIDAA